MDNGLASLTSPLRVTTLIGNKTGGILNNALPFTGFVIRNNAGHNPVGPITAPDFPNEWCRSADQRHGL